jgi:hypothetical protein
MDRNKTEAEGLSRYRSEAGKLLGIPAPPAKQQPEKPNQRKPKP